MKGDTSGVFSDIDRRTVVPGQNTQEVMIGEETNVDEIVLESD